MRSCFMGPPFWGMGYYFGEFSGRESLKFHHTQVPHQLCCRFCHGDFAVLDLLEVHVHVREHVWSLVAADAFGQLLTEEFTDCHDFGCGFGEFVVHVVDAGSHVCLDPVLIEETQQERACQFLVLGIGVDRPEFAADGRFVVFIDLRQAARLDIAVEGHVHTVVHAERNQQFLCGIASAGQNIFLCRQQQTGFVKIGQIGKCGFVVEVGENIVCGEFLEQIPDNRCRTRSAHEIIAVGEGHGIGEIQQIRNATRECDGICRKTVVDDHDIGGHTDRNKCKPSVDGADILKPRHNFVEVVAAQAGIA